MFVKAIEEVSKFTRPIHTISRFYRSTAVIPGAATLFFVNENGYAITCKHVAQMIQQAELINKKYTEFLAEEKKLTKKRYNKELKNLEKTYSLNEDSIIQIKNLFPNCVDKSSGINIFVHPTCDLAIIQFLGFTKTLYGNHAIFLKDSGQIKQGKSLCRLGYPFPEFTNYKYDNQADDIQWMNDGSKTTPQFPIEGMVTRMVGSAGISVGIEMSTPGLKGQSGGPLFDNEGIVYGMQFQTKHLHLGFDIKDREINEGGKKKKVSNNSFLHLGECVHVDIIKEFLRLNKVKYYEN